MDPQERDSYVIGLPIMDALGMLSPLHQWPIFVLVKLVQPNLIPLLQDIPEKTRNRVAQAVQEAHFANIAQIQVWESIFNFAFKPCYSIFAELINSAMADIRNFGKLIGALGINSKPSSSTRVVTYFVLIRTNPKEDWQPSRER